MTSAPTRPTSTPRASIDGREFLSGFIHGYDSFSFRRPNYPFTFIRAVQAGASHARPLTELRVEIRTSRTNGAGTDDNVYLRINDSLRFQLDHRVHDDFERGDVSTYSLPVDTTAPFDRASLGHLLREIKYLQIEKSKDGGSGAWRLGGITVIANGRVHLPQHRSRALVQRDATGPGVSPSFTPPAPTSRLVPVWLTLFDSDSFIYGDDDHADINPSYRRKNLGLEYALGTVVDATTKGGSRYSTTLEFDGDKADVRYLIDTLQSVPPQVPTPPASAASATATSATSATAATTAATATASTTASTSAAAGAARSARRGVQPDADHREEPGHRRRRPVRDRVQRVPDAVGSRPRGRPVGRPHLHLGLRGRHAFRRGRRDEPGRGVGRDEQHRLDRRHLLTI